MTNSENIPSTGLHLVTSIKFSYSKIVRDGDVIARIHAQTDREDWYCTGKGFRGYLPRAAAEEWLAGVGVAEALAA